MTVDAELRSERPQRILFCRTDRLGDVLLSLPCALLAKRLFPDCRVDFLVQRYTAPLIRMVPFVDGLFEIDQEMTTKNISDMLTSENFDAAIALYPEFRLAKALRAAGIGVRSGIAYRWYAPLFTYHHREHRKANIKHELEYNLSLTFATFFRQGRWEEVLPPEEIYPFDIRIPDEANNRLSRILDAVHEADRKIVAIHPGGSGSAHRWPVKSYCALAKKLAAETGALLVVTGVEEELELCHEVSCAAEGSTLNLCHRLSLEELASLYSRCDLLLTNSTGPLHLARALGIQVLGLFPSDPTMTPIRWGPYGLPSNAMTLPSGKSIECLEIKSVLNRALELLEGNA